MTYLWAKGEAIAVKSDTLATPLVFVWQGRTHQVQRIAKRWRVDQGWWRKRIWREYFKLTPLKNNDDAESLSVISDPIAPSVIHPAAQDTT